MPNLGKGPSGVTSKLADLQDRFIGYEKQIEQEARTRHDVEESRMLSIRDTILKLEKTLNSEIKRRVESNKSLQTLFENKISTVQEQIESVFLEKIDQLHSTVEEKAKNHAKIMFFRQNLPKIYFFLQVSKFEKFRFRLVV